MRLYRQLHRQKKVGDENRQNRLILGDSGDEESDHGFETFMPHRFFYYKSRVLKCQYRQQGGKCTIFREQRPSVPLPHTPSQLAEVTNSQLKYKYRILGTLPIL